MKNILTLVFATLCMIQLCNAQVEDHVKIEIDHIKKSNVNSENSPEDKVDEKNQLTRSQKMMVLNKLKRDSYKDLKNVNVEINFLEENTMSGIQNLTTLKGVLAVHELKEIEKNEKDSLIISKKELIPLPIATINVKGAGKSYEFALNNLLFNIKTEDIFYNVEK